MQEGCPLLLEKRLRLKDHEKIESSRPVGLLHQEILADLASPLISLEFPVLASLIPEAEKQAWSFRPTSIIIGCADPQGTIDIPQKPQLVALVALDKLCWM